MIRRSLIALAVSAICAPRGVLAGLLPADGTPLRYAPDDAADRLAREQFGYVSGQHFTRSLQLNEHWMEHVVYDRERVEAYRRWARDEAFYRSTLPAAPRRRVIVHQDARSITFADAP